MKSSKFHLILGGSRNTWRFERERCFKRGKNHCISRNLFFPLIFFDSISNVNSAYTQRVYLSQIFFIEKLLFQHFFRFELYSQLLILFSQFPLYYSRNRRQLFTHSTISVHQFHDLKKTDNILMATGHLRIHFPIVTFTFFRVYIILLIIIISYAQISFNTKAIYVNSGRFTFIK